MKPHIDRVKLAHDFLYRIFAESLHAKRIESLANGALGVMTGASLAVSVIGHSLAQARSLVDKHAIKQVDRLLSNRGVVVWETFAPWVREVVGPRKQIVVAMDWTDFDADDQTTLALNLVTRHGRATPLIWLTVSKDELKDRRNDYEDLCLSRLAEVLPEGVAVTILADRGFGDTKLFAFLGELGSPMSSAFAAISMSPRPTAKRATPPIGSARAAGRANCATPRSRRVGTRSGRSSASMPGT
jgi:hypothetical protein